jgi:hypothetical protein
VLALRVNTRLAQSAAVTTLALGFVGVWMLGTDDGDDPAAADPRSLGELALTGGATEAPMGFEDIARVSELVVHVRVADVRPSRLNTGDGAFPTGASIRSDGLGELTVFTEVALDVVDVLAVLAEVSEPTEGHVLTIVVGGGAVFPRLDADQVAALGLVRVVETRPNPDGEGFIQVEAPIEGPLDDFVWGSAPHGDLVEGRQVIIFLQRIGIPSYDGETTFDVWGPVHADGILHPSQAGWVTLEGEAAPLDEMLAITRAR